MKQTAGPTLALFASVGALTCCALPALFVALGMGAAVAGLVSAAPWLVALSAHKAWLFAGAGALLAAAGWLRWRSRNDPCPADPAMAKACARLRSTGGVIYGFAVALFLIGFGMAYVAPRLIG